MNNLKKFIRDEILDFQEYKTVSSVWDLAKKFKMPETEVIKLDQGENFFGVSPKLKKVLGQYNFYNYYPDPEYKNLRIAISKSIKVPMEKIMVGSGSDELIDLIFRLTLNISDKVVNFPPSFGMYEVSIKLNRGKVIGIPRDEDFSIDISQALKKIDSKTKIIIVCSPNNPTGGITPREDIIKLLKTGKLVLLDEAYAEYADSNNLELIRKYPNLILLRTFSKWAGIAGLRLGYVVMDKYLISQLMKIKPPFNVNLAAEAAGIAILSDLKFAQKNISKLKVERERLSKKLSALPYLKVLPSETNFLFVKFLGKDFEKFRDYLNERQIVVRYFVSELTGNSMRITVGNRSINDKVIKAFNEYKGSTFDGIIFDMDGVLIDVRRSCRLTVLNTVNYFLKTPGSKNKVTKLQVNSIKSIPGFNNDWNASYRLLDLLTKRISYKQFKQFARPLSASEKKSAKYKKIREIWQVFYLGSDEFERTESKKAPFKNMNPLRFQEKLLVKKELLRRLSVKFGDPAIATSRPRQEALFGLRQFGLDKFFNEKSVVAQEDVKKEKPNPEPLLEAKKRIGSISPIYVGDTINDILAAKNAGMPSVYVGEEKLGDYQIKSVNELGGILNG